MTGFANSKLLSQNLHLGHFEAKWILELCHVPQQALWCYDTNAEEQLSSRCAGAINALSQGIEVDALSQITSAQIVMEQSFPGAYCTAAR